ncbi:MAG: EamA family transporter [Ardenticatenaceae bacterium]|nr:EamA family transporter [Ardenticatenaceae bacterium]
MQRTMMKIKWGNGRFRGIPIAILASACWGTSGLFVSRIMGEGVFSTWQLAFWREVTTVLTLLVLLGLIRPSLLRVRTTDLPWLLGMGLGMGMLHVTWNVSVMTNGIPVATVMQYNAPILVAIAAWFLWREVVTGRKAAAIALAIAGTILITGLLQSGTGVRLSVPGVLVGLGTAVAYGGMTLFGQKLAGQYSPWTINFYVFTFAMLALLPFQVQAGLPTWPLPGVIWLPFAALVIIPTICGYALYTLSLRWLPASDAVIVSVTEVVFAAILAFVLLRQAMDGWQSFGALLVIASVVLLSWPGQKR